MANWILENLYIIAFVVIGIVSWVKQMLEARQQQAPPPHEEPYEEYEMEPDWQPPTHHEQDKEILLPMPPMPPPYVAPAPMLVPAEPVKAVAESHDTILAKQHALQERMRSLRQSRGEKKAASARVAKQPAPPMQLAAQVTIRQQLRSRSSIRRAFLMREILGPPVGLR